MIENYINKIESNPESFCHLDGDRLREWQKDLAFYWSGESTKADYAIVNKTPTYTIEPEKFTDGKFGGYSKIKSPLIFNKKNLECLTDNINLSFWLSANVINGFYTIYLKPKQDFKIEAGDYSFSIQLDGNMSKQITLNLQENESFTTIGDMLSFQLTPDLGVDIDLDQTSDDIIAIKTRAPGTKFSIFEGTEGTDLLTKVDVSDISYGTVPSEDIFNIISLEGEKNSLKIAHTKETENKKIVSKLRFTYVSEGVQKTTAVTWNNNGLKFDHVEVDIDSSVMYVFINGILSKVVLISPIERKAEYTTLTINGSEKDFYSIEELIIKDKLQNKESFNVPTAQLTKYDTNQPYIDYYFSGKNILKDSVAELLLDCSDGVDFILNYNGIFYYYNQGSWRQSDGSFGYSNDQYTFVNYIKEFTFTGEEEFFIRTFFDSDGSNEQYLKRLQFSLDSKSIYGDESKTAAILVGLPSFNPDEEGNEQVIDLNGKDLVIKTDLGTTKLVFPKDMTLDETVKFISDAFPEGIVKVQKDSQNRLVLVSETKGDGAFIKVEGEAADILFGDQKTAQGTDQDKNTLDKDYADFIEAIKKYATNDLIPIEIDDDQIRMYLKEAINLYKKYRNDELNTYQLQLKGNATEGYEIPPVVEDWHDITDILFRPLFPLGFYTGSFDNDAEDIVELSLINAMGGVDYSSFYGKGFQTDYYISLMNISSMEQILGLTPSWRVYNNRLFILPNNITKYTNVTIVYKAPIDPIKALRDPYIIQYVYGKIRMAQAEVRGQYGSNLSTGGLAMTFNADSMYERGKDAVDKAIENMKGEQQPLSFIIG